MHIPFEMLGSDKVVISLDDFEDLMDALAYDTAKARGEELFPETVLDRLIAGHSPIQVFRDYRGLTQTALAEKAGVSQALIAEIETGKKQGSIHTLKAVAQALNLSLDDLV